LTQTTGSLGFERVVLPCRAKARLCPTTALQIVARFVEAKPMQLLIDHGADVNCIDNDGKTPLHWAVMNGRNDIIKMLISAGADKSIKDRDNLTPLQLAKCLAKSNLYELL
jgi:ankyrin repeat protein